MTEHCPEDGCFIGDAGCTSERHEHTPLVKSIVKDTAAKKVHEISEADCDAALTEGFYVNGPNGKRIGFGRSLLKHINEGHGRKDIEGRKTRLLYAVNAVMFPTKSEDNHRSIPGRMAYFKEFEGFGIQAISSKEGNSIEYVFTYIPKRSNKGGGK